MAAKVKEIAYPLAPQGVYATIQGEGALMGLPMIFVRLAGCSVGCSFCDTNYTVKTRSALSEITDKISRLSYGSYEWIWITGGEPTDHDIMPLVKAIHGLGQKVALATAGIKKVQRGWFKEGVDFLSVSPHSLDKWVQRTGDQLNLVPGLNGLKLADFEEIAAECPHNFSHCYVTPLADREGRPENLKECIAWAESHRGWKIGAQAHKLWGLP